MRKISEGTLPISIIIIKPSTRTAKSAVSETVAEAKGGIVSGRERAIHKDVVRNKVVFVRFSYTSDRKDEGLQAVRVHSVFTASTFQ